MRNRMIYSMLVMLLLIFAGCGNMEEQTATEPEPAPPDPPAPVALSVSDFHDVLADLDLSGATLTYNGEVEDACPAGAAIRAGSYVETLRDFTWEVCDVPEDWDGSGGYRYQLTAPGVTLTAFQRDRNLHVVTDSGEGLFTLPSIEDAQVNWMIFDTFEFWYNEARAAVLYSGEGTPLTVEEMNWFEDYTASVTTDYDETRDDYIPRTTAISCFFTSEYSDPKDMDAQAFLYYCPDQGILGEEDEEEFRLVQAKLDWRSGEDNHLFTVMEMPVPCHRLPRSYINEILTQYAGITVEEMHTDWTEEALYILETDCFYSLASDFGPGSFTPRYGEKTGDIVTLWSSSHMLTLQKSGEFWHILSHEPVDS